MRSIVFLVVGFLYASLISAQTPVTLQLPEGFGAKQVAADWGRVRHIAVNQNGDLYMKLDRLKQGYGIVRLRDKDRDGLYDDTLLFGDYTGTGIALGNGFLYASSNKAVFRYALDKDMNLVDPSKPERIVHGLIDKGQHGSKSITLDNQGYVYVNIGAPSNVCQVKDRMLGSPGMMPCTLLDSAGGIWRFRTDRTDQSYGDGMRYATGLRNVVGLDWNPFVNDLFVTVHGRDMLHQHYPEIYDAKLGAEMPAETFYRIPKGADGGWPYVYWDHLQKKKILSPEYGGDGKKQGAPGAIEPLMGFPGHLAPNALLFYRGDRFPKKYREGAFVAFHGSWNRSPEVQEGFYVVFIPMKDGKPVGDWEVFADGFTGKGKVANPRDAMHRPCGLAMGPDGSIYVSDDAKGMVWKIDYKGK